MKHNTVLTDIDLVEPMFEVRPIEWRESSGPWTQAFRRLGTLLALGWLIRAARVALAQAFERARL